MFLSKVVVLGDRDEIGNLPRCQGLLESLRALFRACAGRVSRDPRGHGESGLVTGEIWLVCGSTHGFKSA